MAQDRDKIVLQWKAAANAKIRYGRAVLTVRKSVWLEHLEAAIGERKAGESTDTDLAWAFVRGQVVSYTSSFDWKTADLSRLLPRVGGAIEGPAISVERPEDLLPELERLSALEIERWQQLSEQIRTQLLPSFSSQVREDLSAFKAMPGLSGFQVKAGGGPSFSGKFQEVDAPAFKQVQETLKGLDKLKGTFFQSLISTAPVGGLADAGFDGSVFEDFVKISEPIDFGETFLGRATWDGLVKRSADAAQKTEAANDLIEVVETAEVEAEKEVDNIDLDRLGVEFTRLIDQIERLASAQDSQLGKTILTIVIGNLILYFIQYVLAVKYGIVIPTPGEPGR